MKIVSGLLCPPGDAPFGQVIDRNLNGHVVTGKNFDVIHSKLARNMGGHYVPVRQLDLKYGIRECLDHRTLEFDNVVFRQNNHPF